MKTVVHGHGSEFGPWPKPFRTEIWNSVISPYTNNCITLGTAERGIPDTEQKNLNIWKMLIYVNRSSLCQRWRRKWGQRVGCFSEGLRRWLIRYMNIVCSTVHSLRCIQYSWRFGRWFYFILSIMKCVCIMAKNLLTTGEESISKTSFISDIS